MTFYSRSWRNSYVTMPVWNNPKRWYHSLSQLFVASFQVVYFTALFPYIVLIILLINGVTLTGAGKGVLFYLKPEWHRLAESQVRE